MALASDAGAEEDDSGVAGVEDDDDDEDADDDQRSDMAGMAPGTGRASARTAGRAATGRGRAAIARRRRDLIDMVVGV
jgi:hypothetical protein